MQRQAAVELPIVNTLVGGFPARSNLQFLSGPATPTAVGSPVRAAPAVTGHSPGRRQRDAVSADAGRAVGPIRADSADTAAILAADQTARNDQEAGTAARTIGANTGVRPGAVKIAPAAVVASMRLFWLLAT
jgi:hypothetical protein